MFPSSQTHRKITAALVAVGLSAMLLGASSEPDSSSSSESYVLVGSRSVPAQQFIDEGRSSVSDLGDKNGGAASPFLIDFPQWIGCFSLNDSEMVIRDYVMWWNGVPETKRLRCGEDSSFGYKHIRAQHEGDWQRKLNKITPSGHFPNVSWDDLMNSAVVNALMVPDHVQNVSGGKRCLVVKMGFYDKNNVLLDAYNVRAVVSLTNDRVITALPLSDGKSLCG